MRGVHPMTEPDPKQVIGTLNINVNLDGPLGGLQRVLREGIARAAFGLRSAACNRDEAVGRASERRPPGQDGKNREHRRGAVAVYSLVARVGTSTLPRRARLAPLGRV